MMYGYGYWGMIIGAVIMLVVLLGFVLLVVWAVRRTGSGSGRPQTAREVLDLRYLRNEITREQYEQMKQDFAASGIVIDGALPSGNRDSLSVWDDFRRYERR